MENRSPLMETTGCVSILILRVILSTPLVDAPKLVLLGHKSLLVVYRFPSSLNLLLVLQLYVIS